MLPPPDLHLIPHEQTQQLSENLRTAVRHDRREDGRRTEEGALVQAREDVGGGGEEGLEAEGEVVGRVAGLQREEVAGNDEGRGADGGVDWGGGQLGC